MNQQSDLPKGWRWVKLGEVARIFAGSSAPQDPRYFENGKYPFVRVRDLGRYKKTNDLKDVKDYINDVAIEEFNLVKAEKGTILFPKSGAAITTNNRAILGIDAFIVSHLAALKPKEEIADNRFVYYWLYLTDMVQYMENPGYPSLKLSTISEIPIPLPPLNEQKHIAAKLHEQMQEVERARTACEKQLGAAKALPSAYLREAFESEEAKKWERKKLGEITKRYQYGFTATSSADAIGYPLLRISDISDNGSLRKEGLRFVKCDDDIYKKYRLEEGDIVIARSGSVGRSFLYQGEPQNTIFASYLIRFKPMKGIINPKFLFYFTHSNEYLRFIDWKKHVLSQPNINAQELKSLKVPLPSFGIQRRIAAELKAKITEAEKLRKSIEEQLEAINTLPQAILRKAFRGKL